MLDPRYVAENLENVRAALARRSGEAAAAVDALAELVTQRRQLVTETETLKARRNAANQEMSQLAKGPDKAAFATRRDELKTLSAQVKEGEERLGTIEAELTERLLGVPNLPHESTPDGHGEADNPVVRTWGEAPELRLRAEAALGCSEPSSAILDFERAAKLSGARFAVLLRRRRAARARAHQLHARPAHRRARLPRGAAAVLGDAAATMHGTGQLPKFEEDLFKTQRSDPDDPGALYLIPTAEVPLTNLHADEILDAERAAPRLLAYTPCFRGEAGSLRQGHPRPHPPAPVRQGRAGALRARRRRRSSSSTC